jgi:hypothetical protein
MTRSQADVGVDLCQVLVESYAVSERMNLIVLEHLDPGAWRAKLPGSKGRTIAAIFSHVHNIRRKWLRLSAPHLKLPAPLDRARCTQEQARAALVESAARCSDMLADLLSRRGVETFRRGRPVARSGSTRRGVESVREVSDGVAEPVQQPRRWARAAARSGERDKAGQVDDESGRPEVRDARVTFVARIGALDTPPGCRT